MRNPKTTLAYMVSPFWNQNHVHLYPYCFWDEDKNDWFTPTFEIKITARIREYGYDISYGYCPIQKRLDEIFKKRDSIPKINEEKVGGILL
jgi:hypothetical protein